MRAEPYVAQLRREFPRLQLVSKSGDRLSLVIDRALRVVTLGGQSAYLSQYVTTLGSTIYLPLGWDERSDADRYITLRHEAVHLRQFRRFGWVGMAVLYLLPLLPLGLAWGRTWLEWEAYRETLQATAEVYGPRALDDPALRRRIERQFTSGAYGWMCPFPGLVRRWIDRAVRDIELEYLGRDV